MSVPAEHPKKLLFVHYDKTNERIIEPLKLSATVSLPQQQVVLTGTAGSAIAGPATLTITVSRDQDNVVTLSYPTLKAVTDNAANMAFVEVLPVNFRPAVETHFIIPVEDNVAKTFGTLGITTAGVVTIGAGTDPTVVFVIAANGGVQATGISYHV